MLSVHESLQLTQPKSVRMEKYFMQTETKKKESSCTYIKQTKNLIKTQVKDLNRHFFKESKKMAHRPMKRCLISLITRKIQIKTTLRYHLTPVRMAVSKIDEK